MANVLQGMGTINFEVFLNGTSRTLGIATVELVTATHETVDLKGSGWMGTSSMPIAGNLESVEMKLTWRMPNEDTSKAFQHRSVELSLYSVQEHYNTGTGALPQKQHRLEVRGIPKSWNLGKWEPSATVDAETTIEVIVLGYYINGVEQLYFDKGNYVMRVGGKDEGKEIRRGLGLI